MMKSTDKLKYHSALIKEIKSITKKSNGQIVKVKSPIHNIKSVLKPNANKFSIDFQVKIFDETRKQIQLGKTYKNVGFKTKTHDLILEELYIDGRGITNFSGSINQLFTKGYSKKPSYYYRCIIPIKKELNFHYYIKHTAYTTDLGIRSSLCTEIDFEGNKIELYSLRDKTEHYAIVDINNKTDFEKFSQIVFATLVSYGYITGFMPGDKGYYIAYTKQKMETPKHLYFTSMRESSASYYHPIHSNAFGIIREKGKLAEEFQKKLRPISIDEFSKLFEKVHNKLEFSSVLLLIIESSIASLLFMPGGYAIALEALSKLIVTGKKSNLVPISDKILRDKVISECQTIITSNCSTLIDKESLNILLLRISTSLNNPTNKAQLKAPFDKLDIKLLNEDLDLLATRNDFLHGRLPNIMKSSKDRTITQTNEDLYYCGLRFYTLLNILILKWIGYDNYVINYPKIAERGTKIKLPKEKPFRIV